jgi:DNA-binding CsgD family transcriptional regulator/PAS domain-containing protein
MGVGVIQPSLAAAPLVAARDRSDLSGDLAQQAAAAVARSFAENLGADGAMILLQDDREDRLLAVAGRLNENARPPAPPFMLSGDGAGGRSAWRQGGDGLWLTVSVSMPVGAGHGTLLLAARFQREPSTAVVPVVQLALPSLQAFASALAMQHASERRLASYEAALDRSELGIILLDCEGTLLFANHVADQLLAAGDHLRRKGDGISARDLGDAIRLQVAIEHVCNGDGGEVESPVLALKRRHPLRPLLVCISPAAIERGGTAANGVTLRIIDPDRDVMPLLEPICAHYRLSPVETRLACQLAGGATLDDAALALRIKPQTARSYLKQVFMKTDTNRQSELVRMLLASTVRARPAGRFRIV